MSMLQIFRLDAEGQFRALTGALLALERNPSAAGHLDTCMRATHSLNGAARIVALDAAVDVAHAMEDCFGAAQRGQLTLRQEHIDAMLRGLDLLERIAKAPDAHIGERSETQPGGEGSVFCAAVASLLADDPAALAVTLPTRPEPHISFQSRPATSSLTALGAGGERVLRVTAENFNRLLGLAGESRVESRRLRTFHDSLVRLKGLHREAGKALDQLRKSVPETDKRTSAPLVSAQRSLVECQQFLAQRLTQLDSFEGRVTRISQRLYDQALACRMQPFSAGVQSLPRLVRDLGRVLGKQVHLEIDGEATTVDREILEKLDAPLGHLLRNAVDHGIESPDERSAAGKPAEGIVRLEARHNAGVLQIVVSDDGRGIDVLRLRETVVRRQLASVELVEKLTEPELLEFLFLPGFTRKEAVSQTCGRGTGLDVVHNLVKQVRGTIRVSFDPGKGTRFLLQLPLTLSVMRALLVDINGEPYAFPLASLLRTLQLPRASIGLLEDRSFFEFEGRAVGLVSARQVFADGELSHDDETLAVVVLGDSAGTFGLVVDRFLTECELVVQPLDARLGSTPGVAAGAFLEDGSPVLIVDVEDTIRSVAKLASTRRLCKVTPDATASASNRGKRVLVVDDSLTVRELERKLLDNRGYEVETAVDGMDAWNAIRTGNFDLVLTGVDMRRMDGIELLTLIRTDAHLKSLPVMIVSYEDREEDRHRGLDAGADCYLTNGDFHDETLVQAVADLVGAA